MIPTPGGPAETRRIRGAIRAAAAHLNATLASLDGAVQIAEASGDAPLAETLAVLVGHLCAMYDAQARASAALDAVEALGGALHGASEQERVPDADDETAAELRELYLVRQEFLLGMHDTASQAGTDRWAAAVGRYDELLMQTCRRHGVDVPWTLHALLSVDKRRDVEARLAAAGFDLPFPTALEAPE